jgi:hypothetical protein
MITATSVTGLPDTVPLTVRAAVRLVTAHMYGLNKRPWGEPATALILQQAPGEAIWDAVPLTPGHGDGGVYNVLDELDKLADNHTPQIEHGLLGTSVACERLRVVDPSQQEAIEREVAADPTQDCLRRLIDSDQVRQGRVALCVLHNGWTIEIKLDLGATTPYPFSLYEPGEALEDLIEPLAAKIRRLNEAIAAGGSHGKEAAEART